MQNVASMRLQFVRINSLIGAAAMRLTLEGKKSKRINEAAKRLQLSNDTIYRYLENLREAENN